ncbi:MAG: lysylphosphatidylglycerol synthase transmembrane domain-containing protein [Paracoccaceae bacterium]
MTPPLPRAKPDRPLRNPRDRLVILGLLTLFLIGIVGVAATTGWKETADQIRKLGTVQLLVLLLLSLLNYGMRGLRWHLFTRALGLRCSFLQDLRHYLGGFAMSVTPGRVGELVRMRWLARESGWPIERTAPLALADRASDLATMGLLLALSAMLATAAMSGALTVAALALVAALIATRPRIFTALITGLYRLTGLTPRLFARARRAARALHVFSRAPVFVPAILFGLVGWAAEAYGFYLLLFWFGADLGLARAMTIFLFATLAGGLTGAPGGIGGAEAAMIALLSLDGVPMDQALAATAVIRLTTLWFAVLIGMVAFPIAERYSMKRAA